MMKPMFVLFLALLVMVVPLNSVVRFVQVNAYSGVLLSSWTSNPPTIDGIIDEGTEWVMADKESFLIGASYSGTLYVMNDAANLYLAVKIADGYYGTNSSTRDFVMFHFDNDHDEVGPEVGDDCLACISTSTSFDQFSENSTYYWDILNGGADDGDVASSGDGIYNYFEVSHPLNSSDDAHDFSLGLEDTVGFMFRYADNNTFVGTWPAGASPYANPTDWHEIKIAPPIYQGDLILSDNDVYTIAGAFAINGSIIVKDNATLVLKDAEVNFTQTTYNQFNLTLKEASNGNPKLQVSNATIKSNFSLRISFYGNSTISANKLAAYQEVYFYEESSGNIDNSRGLLTIHCYQSSNLSLVGSEFVQMRMHGSSLLFFSGSNATNYIEVYENSNTTVLNSRIRGFGTYGSAQATVTGAELTFFNDQGIGYASFVNMTNTTIADEFRSWGASQIVFSNCTIGFSDIDSSSMITFKDCWFDGVHSRSSAIVTFQGQCIANASMLVEENSTLILEHAVLNFTQAADWELGISLDTAANGNPRLQASDTTVTSNYKYTIDLFENSSASIRNCQFTASLGSYCWTFLWSSSTASINDSSVYGLSSFTSTDLSTFNSSITNFNVYVSGNTLVYNSSIGSMNTYGDASISAERSDIVSVQVFDSSQQHVFDSTVGSANTRNETMLFLTNSTCSSINIDHQSRVFVYWYLDVHVVDDLYNDVPSANVTATFPNATEAESELTGLTGWARLSLMEKVMNATGDYPIGNYTAEASYLTYSNATLVDIAGNQQITLQLEDYVVPESSLLLVLSLLMIATLFVAIAYRKRQHAMWENRR